MSGKPSLTEYVKDQIWILEYPLQFAAMDLWARMTIIKLDNDDLIIHDPCQIDDDIKKEIDALGVVKFIIAPGAECLLLAENARPGHFFEGPFCADYSKKFSIAQCRLRGGLDD